MRHPRYISCHPKRISEIDQIRTRLIDDTRIDAPKPIPNQLIDQIIRSTQARIPKSNPETRARLAHRQLELEQIRIRLSADPDIQIMHILGWGSACTIHAPKRAGLSEIDSIVYRKNGLIYIEQLGTTYQRFTLQKRPFSQRPQNLSLGTFVATHQALKHNATLRFNQYRDIPTQTIRFSGQSITLQSDPSRCQLLLTHPNKQVRLQLAAALGIGAGDDPVPASTHVATIRCTISQLVRLGISPIGLPDLESATQLETHAHTLQTKLKLDGFKQLNYQPESNTWTFHDTFRNGRMTITDPDLKGMITHNAGRRHYWTIKKRAPLLKLLIDTPTPKGILQGQTGKQITTLGLGATRPSAPFIDGIDDLDVAGAQTNLTLGGTGLGAFTLLPFALCILSEGARGANQTLNELLDQLNQARITYQMALHQHPTNPDRAADERHPLLDSPITTESLTTLATTLPETIESLTHDVRAARAEKEAITAMAAGLQLAFLCEMVASLVRWSLGQPHAAHHIHHIESTLSPFTNYFATYGQAIFCMVSALKAIDAHKEASEIAQTIQKLDQAAWPVAHHDWKTDINRYLKTNRSFKQFECGMMTAVSLGQAAMFTASLLAAIWDGGSSMAVLSAATAHPSWITGIRSTGAFQTLTFAAGNSLLDAWHDAHFGVDSGLDWSHLTPCAPIETQLTAQWQHVQDQAIPAYVKAKSFQLAIDHRHTNSLATTIDPTAKPDRWITRKSNVFGHYSEKKRPHYQAVSGTITSNIQSFVTQNQATLSARNEDPIRFYQSALESLGIIPQQSDATSLKAIIDALSDAPNYTAFHEALLDRIAIGRHKHGYTHKGKPFDRYVRSYTISKRRKLYQGNPIKELINGVISKLIQRTHKGPGYYRFKQLVTGDIALSDSSVLKKVKTIRQFDWDTYFSDMTQRPNTPLINRMNGMIYGALDDIILSEAKKQKRNLRTHLFVLPVFIIDNKNTDT